MLQLFLAGTPYINKLLKKGLLVFLASFGLLVLFPPDASAWNVNEDCTFVLSNSGTFISVTCDDNTKNGTLDEARYTLSAGSYRLTQEGPKEFLCSDRDDDDDGLPDNPCDDDRYEGGVRPSGSEKITCSSTIVLGENKTTGTIDGEYWALVDVEFDDASDGHTYGGGKGQCNPTESSLSKDGKANQISIRANDYFAAQAGSKLYESLRGKFQTHCREVVADIPPGGQQQQLAYEECMSSLRNALSSCHESAYEGGYLYTLQRTGGTKQEALESYNTTLRFCLGRAPFTFLSNQDINKAANAATSQLGAYNPPQVDDLIPDDDSTDESETSCAIDGIGWIVCPAMEFLGQLNDAAFGVLNNFLQIEDELTTNRSLRAAWSTFRDMANIAFVIAFLIIIYSQITGMGVTNYGIKRLMPKMIIAAVLVNASLVLCQIAVDLSNIVGSTIYNLLTNLANADSGSTNAVGSWSETIGSLLGVAAIGVGLLLVIILAPTALLAVGAVVLILMARKAIIILLIVVAPLAFVAYLLPNTEDWFKKWWKLFSTLLMLFPVIGLVFGASSLAAGIINNVAGDTDGQHLLQLTALGIMAVPLFAVPVVLKGALGAAGSIGQRLSGLQDRANKRGMRGIKEGRLGEAKDAFAARRQRNKVERRLSGGYVGKGKIGKRVAALGASDKYKDTLRGKMLRGIGAPSKSIDSSRAARLIGADRGAAAATSAYFKAVGEEVDRQGALISEEGAEKLLEIGMNSKETDEKRAAAFKRLASVGGHQHIQKAYDYLDKANAAGENVGDIQQLAADDLLKRKPAGVKTSAANALRTGTLGKVPGSGDGYYNMLKRRVQLGEFGASDYAHMDKDDVIRLGELAQQRDENGNPVLSDDDLNAIAAKVTDIESDETLKGTMNDERRALFESITTRSGPVYSNGAPRQRPGTSTGGLVEL